MIKEMINIPDEYGSLLKKELERRGITHKDSEFSNKMYLKMH
jgi:hypothetical protein